MLSVSPGALKDALGEGAAISWWSPASSVSRSRLAVQHMCSGKMLRAYQHVGIPALSANSCPKRIVTGVTAASSEVLLL